jgi:hypothetical protein
MKSYRDNQMNETKCFILLPKAQQNKQKNKTFNTTKATLDF